MKLSTKGRYAMVALSDIALQPEGTLVSLGDIATRQSVSLPYLEQLFVKLRRANLVASVRGPGGGYRLARPASEIRVVDVLEAVDEKVDAMHKGAGASGGTSGSRAQSLNNRLWEGLSAHVYVFLHQTTLAGGAEPVCADRRIKRVWGRCPRPCGTPPGFFEPEK